MCAAGLCRESRSKQSGPICPAKVCWRVLKEAPVVFLPARTSTVSELHFSPSVRRSTHHQPPSVAFGLFRRLTLHNFRRDSADISEDQSQDAGQNSINTKTSTFIRTRSFHRAVQCSIERSYVHACVSSSLRRPYVLRDSRGKSAPGRPYHQEEQVEHWTQQGHQHSLPHHTGV